MRMLFGNKADIRSNALSDSICLEHVVWAVSAGVPWQ